MICRATAPPQTRAAGTATQATRSNPDNDIVNLLAGEIDGACFARSGLPDRVRLMDFW
jgi:hypothetical protein